ncbi:MAG: hypothetical protein KC777_12610 [Cyanobacteria bacterium HKST-UBA02]|nr:hypothetical protein [Cyanobacteria bacterium HKST-UBA02]
MSNQFFEQDNQVRGVTSDSTNPVTYQAANEFLQSDNITGSNDRSREFSKQLADEGVLPQLLVSEMDKIDIDGNNEITRAELNMALNSKNSSVLTKLAANYALENFKTIDQSNDWFGGLFANHDALSRDDVGDWAKKNPIKEQDLPGDDVGSRILMENRHNLDLNSDDKITQDELKIVLDNSEQGSDLHEAARYASNNFERIDASDDWPVLGIFADHGNLSMDDIKHWSGKNKLTVLQAASTSDEDGTIAGVGKAGAAIAARVAAETTASSDGDSDECPGAAASVAAGVSGIARAVADANAGNNANSVIEADGHPLAQAEAKAENPVVPAEARDDSSDDRIYDACIKSLEDPNSSAEVRLRAMTRLIESGISEVSLHDADGREFQAHLSFSPVAPGSQRNYLTMWAEVDGRQRPVMRAIEDGGMFAQQVGADGRPVSYYGAAWAARGNTIFR